MRWLSGGIGARGFRIGVPLLTLAASVLHGLDTAG
jgi:hypothetical protein